MWFTPDGEALVGFKGFGETSEINLVQEN